VKIEIISKKENPLLKRTEIRLRAEHVQNGSTPPRLEVRKSLAKTLKEKTDRVFIKKLKTKTGTHAAIGLAYVYESVKQAELIEPEYIIKRNIQSERPTEDKKE